MGEGGDWHWCLKRRGVWVVGLSFSRSFFGFLFCFLVFGVVKSASMSGDIEILIKSMILETKNSVLLIFELKSNRILCLQNHGFY